MNNLDRQSSIKLISSSSIQEHRLEGIDDIHNKITDTISPEDEFIEESDVRSIKNSSIELKERCLGRKMVLAIGDLDANDRILIHTLKDAGFLDTLPSNTYPNKNRVVVTSKGLSSPVIQTGDIFDRGPHVLKTFDRIKSLQNAGMDFRITAGNHEIMALSALNTFSIKNNDPVYREYINEIQINSDYDSETQHFNHDLAKKLKHIDLQASDDAHLFLYWYNEGGRFLFPEIQAKYFPHSSPNLMKMINKARELFFETDYVEIIQNMKAMEQIDDVLYLHGGINNTWARRISRSGIEDVNRIFQSYLIRGDLDPFVYDNDCRDLFWLRNGEVLTPYAAKVLKSLGINAIIRGHDRQENGIQSVVNLYGITVINNDIGAGNGNMGGTIVSAAGDIIGFNKRGYKYRTVIAQLPPIKRAQNDNNITYSVA
jgi:hypothetical protein